jgi:hypothetical protein
MKDITSGSVLRSTKGLGTGRVGVAWTGLAVVASITESLRGTGFLLVLILKASKRFKIPLFGFLDNFSPSGVAGEGAKAGRRGVGGSDG